MTVYKYKEFFYGKKEVKEGVSESEVRKYVEGLSPEKERLLFVDARATGQGEVLYMIVSEALTEQELAQERTTPPPVVEAPPVVDEKVVMTKSELAELLKKAKV